MAPTECEDMRKILGDLLKLMYLQLSNNLNYIKLRKFKNSVNRIRNKELVYDLYLTLIINSLYIQYIFEIFPR